MHIHIYMCFTSCSSTSACLGMHISISNPLHIHGAIAHPRAEVLKHEMTHIYAYLCICKWIYLCEDKELAAGFPRTRPPAGFRFFKTDDEFEVLDFAKLQIVETVDEIKVGTRRGARDPRNCLRNQCSEVARSSWAGTPRGHASEMGCCSPPSSV